MVTANGTVVFWKNTGAEDVFPDRVQFTLPADDVPVVAGSSRIPSAAAGQAEPAADASAIAELFRVLITPCWKAVCEVSATLPAKPT